MAHKLAVKKNMGPVNPSRLPVSNQKLFLWAGIIALITLFSFSPALKNEFTNWDDNTYVFENTNLSKPIPEAIKYFFEPHYFIGNYIPLTMITYALEYHAAELKPHFYHTINVLFHLLNVLLVFWFIYLLSGRKPVVAAIVSLFFGIHPMHVESVAWIAELKDVLYGCFFIAGLIYYYKYLEKKNSNQLQNKNKLLRPLIMALIFFVLSTLSKPAAVVFPLVLLLLDFYSGRKFDKWTWIEKLPFFFVSVIFGIIAIESQKADSLIHDYFTFSQRVFFASYSLIEYMIKLFLPIHLSIFYPYPELVEGYLPQWYYVMPFFVLLLFYALYRTLKHSRLILFGFLFFFANIILVLQLISVGDAIMADRYTYISYIGLFFIIGMKSEQFYQKQKSNSYKQLLIVVLFILGIACSSLTHARCKIWKNDDAIATDLLLKFPEDRLALNNKGFILSEQKRYMESIEYFNKAIKLKPDYERPYINLINVYLALNDYDNALKTTDEALKYLPEEYNLLNKKGNILYMQHNYAEAMALYNKAILLKREKVNGYLFLAECHYAMGEYKKGLEIIDKGLKYEPENYFLLNNKGYFLFLLHKYKEAAEYFKAALKRNPDYKTASVNLEDCNRAMNDSTKVKN